MIQTAPRPLPNRILIQTRRPIPNILRILTVIHLPIPTPLPVRIRHQIWKALQGQARPPGQIHPQVLTHPPGQARPPGRARLQVQIHRRVRILR